jgi:hypothetical protein
MALRPREGEVMKTVLVCGDQNWGDAAMIGFYLYKLQKAGYSRVLHGDCRGADRIGGKVATVLGFEAESYPAKWQIFGRSAGPRRNAEMLKKLSAGDIVLAFHDNIGASLETLDMVTRAKDQPGIAVEHVQHKSIFEA